MTGDHLYVYGVVEGTDLELSVEGVHGADRIYTVDHPPFSAVVSDIDEMDPERTDEDATAHDEVLRAVLTHDEGIDVIPMQYGMTFKTGRALKNVLRSGRRAFTKALRDVEGTVELGLKLLAEEDADVDADAVREDVTERLEGLSIEATEDDLFTDRLVVNRSFLVAREDWEAFDEAVEAIEAEYEDSLLVKYSGPWAPYNFVDIEIESGR